jgi:hypothetical protein
VRSDGVATDLQNRFGDPKPVRVCIARGLVAHSNEVAIPRFGQHLRTGGENVRVRVDRKSLGRGGVLIMLSSICNAGLAAKYAHERCAELDSP